MPQYALMINIQMYAVESQKPTCAKSTQPEQELGGFDKSLLDQFDDCLAAIHHLSKGPITRSMLSSPTNIQ